jgi:hypothetical protein
MSIAPRPASRAVPSMAATAFPIAITAPRDRLPLRRSLVARAFARREQGDRSSDSNGSRLFGFVPAPDRCLSPRRRDEGLAASCRDAAHRICAPGHVLPVRHACPSPSRSALPPVPLPRSGRAAGSDGRTWPRASCASIVCPQRWPFAFFPAAPPRAARGDPATAFRAEDKKAACRPPLRSGPSARASGAVRSPPAGRSPSRPQ